MEDKIIVKSEQYNFKKLSRIIYYISLALIALSLLMYLTNFDHCRECIYNESEYRGRNSTLIDLFLEGFDFIAYPSSTLEYLAEDFFLSECQKGHYLGYSDGYVIAGLCLDIGLIATFIWSIIAWYFNAFSITVTDKRIIGRAAWGKKVSIPVDSVSAIASSSFNGIAVASSSGKIVFKLIKNRDEVHQAIESLIITRQNNAQPAAPTASDNLDVLKKYKELLDTGVITEAEFEAKKKETLGL